MTLRVIVFHFGLFTHNIDALYVWHVSTACSGVEHDDSLICGVPFKVQTTEALCDIEGSLCSCFGPAIPRVASISASVNFEIGQDDTKTTFLNGFLTFGDPVPKLLPVGPRKVGRWQVVRMRASQPLIDYMMYIDHIATGIISSNYGRLRRRL